MIKFEAKFSYGLLLTKLQAILYSVKRTKYNKDLNFTEATELFPDRNQMYEYMHHYYSHFLGSRVKKHREYFSCSNRGFGEDAFHSMWFILFREFKPKNCLEIGVYRGQVISLWALLAEILEYRVSIHGISPFESVGDKVSEYEAGIDYYDDVLQNHGVLGLVEPALLKSYSNADQAIDYISNSAWDLVYIDGSHDYDVVLSDYEICLENLASDGLIVFDDSSLYTNYRSKRFSFSGHEGPSKVVRDRAFVEMDYIGGVGHNNIFRKRLDSI